MTKSAGLANAWIRLGVRWLPFADAATQGLPLPRLLRLSWAWRWCCSPERSTA
jgi:hypothetical protein